jgi:hypothetical protein
MDAVPVEYRGCALTPLVNHRKDGFSVMLLLELPDGARQALGPIGRFRSARAAGVFAVGFGKAVLDAIVGGGGD